MISAVPMRKLFITDKGKAWAGITLEDENLVELARKFIAVTQWRGGCELEVMRTLDGKPYIMEVNPRFPAWIYLTAGAGQNQPAALVRMAMGETVTPMTAYAVGKMFIRYSWDLIADVSDFQKISAFGER
jgi:carbamoyl-phosphate synthase large subunit